MNADIARAYDRTPYPDYAFWATHPDHIGMFGRLFGIPTAPPEACRVLEIGCAVGGNLLPMAAALPNSRFVGVDLSGVQIARAKRNADSIGLDNITLIHGDFREVSDRLGPFDYIICHGVFAWVDRPTQQALTHFIRERLALNGVAFVSYNTYPGQHMVDMVRKILAVHTAHAPDLVTKAEQSIAAIRLLRDLSKSENDPWRTDFFNTALKQLQDSGPDLLEHDYCARDSSPAYFSDFIKQCAQSGLAYLADSSPWDMHIDNHSPAVAESLRPLNDLALQGQQLDFIINRRYRETLICRADAPLTRDVPAERLQQFYLGHALQSEPSLDGLDDARPVTVNVARRPPLTVAHPILRLALHRLWRHGRVMPSYPQLAAEVLSDLDARGLALNAALIQEHLGPQLLRAFYGCAVRFSLRAPALATAIPTHPKTGPYQRFMATERRPGITSLTHEVFEASPMMLALLPALDGTRDHAALQALFDAPIAESLALLQRRGFLAK